MAKAEVLTKRVAISKAYAQTVAVIGAASFVTIFCLVAANAAWKQDAYLSRVITAKEAAHKQLVANTRAYNDLTYAYENFVASPNNVIGGSTTGNGSNDGSNAKIVLDALPPSYDFPALVTSLQKLLSNQGFKISSITGSDDQLAEQANSTSPSPQPISIPFTFTLNDGTYSSVGPLMNQIEHSIRPIQIDNFILTGSSSNMSITVTAHTYFQPAKNLSITKKVVK